MNLLVVETATKACSVALQIGDTVLDDCRLTQSGHARIVLPMVDALLKRAGVGLRQLDGIAAGQGPGSFTGIRIGLGVVQGLCLGADIPAVGVSSLAMMAQGASQPAVLAALDARMGQIYAQYFVRVDDMATPIGEAAVLHPDSMSLPAKTAHADPQRDNTGRWYGVGSAFDAYSVQLREALSNGLGEVDAAALPQARDALVLARRAFQQGEGVDAADVLPLYVRNQVTDRSLEKASAGTILRCS